MTRIPRICFIAALAAAPVRAGEPAAPAEDEYEARLTEARGDVTVFTAESPEGAPAAAGLPLAAGDRIQTGAESSAEIGFSGEHCVSLRSNSEFTMASLRRGDAQLQLAGGSLLADIRARLGGSFRVRTPAAVAAVRGTQFGVEVASANPEETHVGVFDEGEVEVAGATGPPEVLKANQETMVRRGSRPLAAYQLKRFARRRQFMRALRKRTLALRKSWRAMTPQRRQELRLRLRELRQQRREEKEKPRVPQAQKVRRQRPDQEKIERLKKIIRERRKRGRP